MFTWLNATLNANPNMKFMTQVHVFFGYNYYRGEQIFWYEDFTNTLMSILEPFQDNHVISIGAHIHHINVVAPYSSVVPNAKIVQIIMPAVSPIYYNNPGFGMLKIDDSSLKIDKFEFVFLMLEDYHRFGVFTYETYNPAKFGGFDINDAESVRKFQDGMHYNFQEFGYWQARNYGLSEYMAIGAQFTWPFAYNSVTELNPQTY